jgi:hypothetical protein
MSKPIKIFNNGKKGNPIRKVKINKSTDSEADEKSSDRKEKIDLFLIDELKQENKQLKEEIEELKNNLKQ